MPGERIVTEPRWPDFFVVGAPKAGTTALYEHLVATPGICIPTKEVHYFDTGIDRSMFFTPTVTDQSAYLGLYTACMPDELAGDCTPSYLVDPFAPTRIAAANPNAKIIVLVRDPVDRAVSHFRFREERIGRNGRTLLEAVQASQLARVEGYSDSYLVHGGRYSEGISRFRDVLGVDRVLVLFFEDLVTNPEDLVRSVTDFLGVPFAGCADLDWRARNASSLPRGRLAARLLRSRTVWWLARRLPTAPAQRWGRRLLLASTRSTSIDPKARALLEAEYAGEARALEILTGRRPEWPWLGRDQEMGV